MPVFRLSEKKSFPPPHFAEPEGLLAVGGDLSEKTDFTGISNGNISLVHR